MKTNSIRPSLLAATLALLATSLLSRGIAAETWERLGPDYEPGGGVTECIAPHPTRAGEWVLGARPGGLLFTTDAGKTWQHASEKFDDDGHVGPNNQSLGRAPSLPERLYVGIEKHGVRRSDDGGRTWREVNAGLPTGRARNGVVCAVHPTNPDIAWLGTDGGLFKTEDGGAKWRRLTVGLPSGKTKAGGDVSQTITRILVDRAEPQRLWISIYATGLNEPAGVWRSDDGGESWAAASSGIEQGVAPGASLPIQRDFVMALDRCAAQPDVFYCVTNLATYRSDDGAKTWKKLPRGSGGGALVVHPRNPDLVFVNGRDGRVDRSDDGGQTWRDFSAGLRLGREPGAPVKKVQLRLPDGTTQQLEGTLHRYQNEVIAFCFDPLDPDTLYACAHAGLYRVRLTRGLPPSTRKP